MKQRKIVPLALPGGLAQEIDELVKQGEFQSRNEALKFAARILVMMMRKTHKRAEDYAYQEIKEGFLRGRGVNVS